MGPDLALRVALAATPEPGVVLPNTPPEELVTPGTVGFLATFAVAVALVLLVRDMTRRNRRIVFEAERRDALRREAEGSGAAGDVSPPQQRVSRGEDRDDDGRPAAPGG